MAELKMKDIARLCGVSTATVSRVVNNDPRVNPQTVERVRETIRELGFVPNTVARNLRKTKTGTIGMLISDISNSYFATIAREVDRYLRAAGYNLMVVSTDDDKDQEAIYLQRFISSQAEGIILNPTNQNDELLVELSGRVPMVLVERMIDHPDFRGDSVNSNYYQGILELTGYLLQMGHRKIGLIDCERSLSTGKHRLHGFAQAMGQAGITVDEHYPYLACSESFFAMDGYNNAKSLMQREDPPTAVLVAHSGLASNALRYFKHNGYSIPEDLSVACYGTLPNHDLFYIDLCYSGFPPYDVGARTAEYIVSRIQNPDLDNRETVFESKLFPGGSVRRLAAPSGADGIAAGAEM